MSLARNAEIGDLKKRTELAVLRTDVQHLRDSFKVSERHACELVGIAVSTFRHQKKADDEGLRQQLVTLTREQPRYGYRRLQVLLGRTGAKVNHKRVWRVYREAGLCVKRRSANGWCVLVFQYQP